MTLAKNTWMRGWGVALRLGAVAYCLTIQPALAGQLRHTESAGEILVPWGSGLDVEHLRSSHPLFRWRGSPLYACRGDRALINANKALLVLDTKQLVLVPVKGGENFERGAYDYEGVSEVGSLVYFSVAFGGDGGGARYIFDWDTLEVRKSTDVWRPQGFPQVLACDLHSGKRLEVSDAGFRIFNATGPKIVDILREQDKQRGLYSLIQAQKLREEFPLDEGRPIIALPDFREVDKFLFLADSREEEMAFLHQVISTDTTSGAKLYSRCVLAELHEIAGDRTKAEEQYRDIGQKYPELIKVSECDAAVCFCKGNLDSAEMLGWKLLPRRTEAEEEHQRQCAIEQYVRRRVIRVIAEMRLLKNRLRDLEGRRGDQKERYRLLLLYQSVVRSAQQALTQIWGDPNSFASVAAVKVPQIVDSDPELADARPAATKKAAQAVANELKLLLDQHPALKEVPRWGGAESLFGRNMTRALLQVGADAEVYRTSIKSRYSVPREGCP